MSIVRGSDGEFKESDCNFANDISPGSYVDFFYDKVKSLHDRVAIIDPVLKKSVTYGKLRQQTNAVASGLTKCGLKKGDIITLIGSNCLEFCPLMHGTLAAGGVLQALKPAIEYDELVYQLRLARPRFVVTTVNVIDFVSKGVKEADAGVEDIFVIGGTALGCRRVEELIEDDGSASPWGEVRIDPLKDDALMLQTSGTTGMSKNVVRTHEMMKHYQLIPQLASSPSVAEDELALCNIPFSHSMPMALMFGAWLLSGIAVVLTNGTDLKHFVQLIDEYKISRVNLTPVSMLAFANASKLYPDKLQSWRYAIVGGSVLSKQKEEFYRNVLQQNLPNNECFQAYGSTEGGFVSLRTSCPESWTKMGSIGKPAPNVQMKVVRLEDHTKLCKANERGEIFTFSKATMKGYFKNEIATKKVMVDGWYKSGDYGYYDEDGYFYVVDRISDLIHHRDGMIIPSELETIISEHPDVDECAVIGVEHSEFGAVPKAFVVGANDISTDDLQAFVNKRVKSYEKLIGGISFTEKLPKSPAGKIFRRQLVGLS